MLRLQVA